MKTHTTEYLFEMRLDGEFYTTGHAMATNVADLLDELVEFADKSRDCEFIRIRRLQSDVPPRDITQDILSILIDEWDFADERDYPAFFEQAKDRGAESIRDEVRADIACSEDHERFESAMTHA